MGGPADALPQPIAEDDIQALLRSKGLPEATKIVSPKVTAEYHAIYFITVTPCDESHGHSELVLRVSGYHLPTIKTRNEIGVMCWLSQNTTIPIPDLIAYDDSADNPAAHEYTLLSRVNGVTFSDVYDSLDDARMTVVLDQLIDFLVQLHTHSWDGIGGIALNEAGGPALAQVVDENFWQVPDIEQYWPGETVASLNIQGPFHTYIDYISAQIQQYCRLIQRHKTLEFMTDILPRLQVFVASLPHHSDELNSVALRLAHKDMHFANLLFDASSNKVTAVLDWEFSGVVPFTKWNPARSFLWNGRKDASYASERQRLMQMFEERCAVKGVSLLEDAKYRSPLQDSMQLVADYLRAIVEVSPRGQRQDLVQGWKAVVVENLEIFGA
ncbi:kinase-like domain-containing protein [Lasiosphaeris hirsuta]|uniref:Kinase-like domain-containing protein n=1 Tax=Lasiosphaeris hirsuta TaxID=260670 RepID=A0AA40A7F1_9PEZI|nr:kinase-like domain-containing protein [Lasiosphaeris hirsuta]